MKIFVEDVENGAEYENTVYDYWVTALLVNERRIKLFDFVPFDLRKRKGQMIEVLILAGFPTNISASTAGEEAQVSGEYLGEIALPSHCTKFANDADQRKWVGIKTDCGVFLLNPGDFEQASLKLGGHLQFNVGRFDLIGVTVN